MVRQPGQLDNVEKKRILRVEMDVGSLPFLKLRDKWDFGENDAKHSS